MKAEATAWAEFVARREAEEAATDAYEARRGDDPLTREQEHAALVGQLWALVEEMRDAQNQDDGYGRYTSSGEWARDLAALLPPRLDSTLKPEPGTL